MAPLIGAGTTPTLTRHSGVVRRAGAASPCTSACSPGATPHHIVEAQFKAVARALRDAVALDPRAGRAQHQGRSVTLPASWLPASDGGSCASPLPVRGAARSGDAAAVRVRRRARLRLGQPALGASGRWRGPAPTSPSPPTSTLAAGGRRPGRARRRRVRGLHGRAAGACGATDDRPPARRRRGRCSASASACRSCSSTGDEHGVVTDGLRRVARAPWSGSTRRCCRTWAGTRSTAPPGSVLFAGSTPTRGSTSSTPTPRARWTLDTARPHRPPLVTWAEHGEPFVAAVENGPLWRHAVPPGEVRRRRRGHCCATGWRHDRRDGDAVTSSCCPPSTCRRPGRPAGPGRGRHRDLLRRPAGGRAGLAGGRRRVDPPGRPRRRLRPRLQRGAARRRGRPARRRRSSCPAASATTRRWRPRWPPAAARVNIGTAALEDPEWCAAVIAEYGDRVAVGLDVRGGPRSPPAAGPRRAATSSRC